MERIAVFVDGGNFYHGLREEVNTTSLDFSEFFKILTKDRQLDKNILRPFMKTKK